MLVLLLILLFVDASKVCRAARSASHLLFFLFFSFGLAVSFVIILFMTNGKRFKKIYILQLSHDNDAGGGVCGCSVQIRVSAVFWFIIVCHKGE